MSTAAYSIGIKISLLNHASMGLMALSRDFVSAGAAAAALEARMLSIRNMGIRGGIMMGAGAVGLSLFKAPLDEAKHFQTELARFSSLGFGGHINAEAAEFARGMKTIGTSSKENMEILGDSMAVFKDFHEAKMAAPVMAKMKFANHALFGDMGGARDKNLMDMMKVIEYRGGSNNIAEFNKQADFAQKAIAGSRNRVNPAEMLQALKTGGLGLAQRSNEAFYLQAEPLIQEFGGSRYGTASMSLYQNLVQMKSSTAALRKMDTLGLLDQSKVVRNTKTDKLMKAGSGALIGGDVLIKEGEVPFLNKVLLPALAKKGITDEKGILDVIGAIAGNRTGASLLSRAYLQRDKLTMQGKANEKAEGIDGAVSRASKTAEGNEIALLAAKKSLYMEIGTSVLPTYISAIELTTSTIKGLTGFFREHQTITKGLALSFAALSGGLVLRGGFLLLSAALRGLGLAAVTSGFSALYGSIGRISSVAGSLSSRILTAGRVALPLLIRGMALIAAPVSLPIAAAIAAFVASAALVYRYWQPVKAFLKGVFSGMSTGLAAAAIKVKTGFLSMATSLKASSPMLSRLFDSFMIGARRAGLLIPDMKKWFSGLLKPINDVGGAANLMGVKVGQGIARAIVWAGKMLAAFAGLPGKMAAIGANIMTGLLGGIKSRAASVLSTITGIASNISGAFKSALGIQSPSRVFIGHGSDIVGGLVLGISGNSYRAKDVTSKLSKDTIAAMSKAAVNSPVFKSGNIGNIPKSAINSPVFKPGNITNMASVNAKIDGNKHMPTNTIAKGHGKHIQTHTTINLDGRKIAETVSQHQSRAISRAATSGGRFDSSMSMPPVAMNYHK